jgi:integrase
LISARCWGSHLRARFPDTDPAELALLPAPLRNPHGTRALPLQTVGAVHRRWVLALPPLLGADGSEFPRKAVVPYAYRHSYAQRHADAGVPPDVLRDLMGHRSMTTTQVYYNPRELHRTGEKPQVTRSRWGRNSTTGSRKAAA